VAGKFGLTSAEPLLFFTMRFLFAGVLLLSYSLFIKRQRLPEGEEWKQLAIFGAFNTALYLGIFIIALQYITAGITALAIAINPLLISLMSSMFYGRKVLWIEWLSILLGMLGVFTASYPLLGSELVSVEGLLLLGLSMVAYSFGSVYYASIKWKLDRVSINGWQVLIGGMLIMPFAFLLYDGNNHFDATFWFALLWLIIPVSIGAVQLWLILLKTDAVRASLWLYLCPIFGLLFSAALLREPLSYFTLTGTLLVLSALFIGQQKLYSTRSSS
jgi:probable blue pigment (indigoidine) exporter